MIDNWKNCLEHVKKQEVMPNIRFQTYPHEAIRQVLCSTQLPDWDGRVAVNLLSQWGRCKVTDFFKSSFYAFTVSRRFTSRCLNSRTYITSVRTFL